MAYVKRVLLGHTNYRHHIVGGPSLPDLGTVNVCQGLFV
jgi:hypothetical protein